MLLVKVFDVVCPQELLVDQNGVRAFNVGAQRKC